MTGGQKIIEHSHNAMAYDFYENHLTSLNHDLIISDYTKFPEKYQQWKGEGDFWHSKMNAVQFMDVLMHLLFLGVTKSARELIYEWLCETKRLVGYKLLANNIFKSIAEMGLDWCKLLVATSG